MSRLVGVLRILSLVNLAHWIVGAIIASQTTDAKSISPNIWTYAVTDVVLHALCFVDFFVSVKKEKVLNVGSAVSK